MTNAIYLQFQLDYGAFKLDVDLKLPNTGITVLFGHSGSGKTTLLRCIAGLQPSQRGYLAINGQIWQDSQQHIFLPTHRRAIGYVFQEANLFPHLTVAANIQFGLKRLSKPHPAMDLNYILNLLGITHLLQRKPNQLSGGERQRVAIARALVLQPEILLMDEPLAALDNQRKQEILPFLDKLHRELKIPILYVTHARQEVARLADHLIILSEGKVIAEGSLTETLGRLDTPLAIDKDAASVWLCTVIAHDTHYYLTRLAFSDGVLDIPLLTTAIGSCIRIQIAARDVSITLKAPEASSILNILTATITDIVALQAGQCLLRLSLGQAILLAHISQKSVEVLDLVIGMQVFVQIKGTSILN